MRTVYIEYIESDQNSSPKLHSPTITTKKSASIIGNIIATFTVSDLSIIKHTHAGTFVVSCLRLFNCYYYNVLLYNTVNAIACYHCEIVINAITWYHSVLNSQIFHRIICYL